MFTRIIPFIALLILTLSCGDSGVIPREDPTDQDAIYNIIRFDRPSEFNIDLLDFSIPDTLIMSASNIVVESFWYDLDSTTYFIGIDIEEIQPGDSLGTVPKANVNVSKNFFGSVEIIGTDTTGGGSVQVRLSTDFRIIGNLSSGFDKLGFNSDDRRGWILTRISDVRYSQPGGLNFTGSVNIISNSYPDHTVNTSIKNISETLTFSPGESLNVTITFDDTPTFTSLRYPFNNSVRTINLDPDSSGVFRAGFRIPNSVAYNHFLVSSTYIDVGADTVLAEKRAAGILYRAR